MNRGQKQNLLILSATLKDSPDRIEQVSLGFDLEEESPTQEQETKPANPTPAGSASKKAAKPGKEKNAGDKAAEAQPEQPAASASTNSAPAELPADNPGNGVNESDSDKPEEAERLRVTELGNTEAGCWMVLSDGSRQELSDKEWRGELKRLLSKDGAGGD